MKNQASSKTMGIYRYRNGWQGLVIRGIPALLEQCNLHAERLPDNDRYCNPSAEVC